MKRLDCGDEKYKEWFETISLYIQTKEMFESVEKIKAAQVIMTVLIRSCLNYYDIRLENHKTIMKNQETMIYKVLNGEHHEIIRSKCIYEIVLESISIIDD
jgi:hypothetical protein